MCIYDENSTEQYIYLESVTQTDSLCHGIWGKCTFGGGGGWSWTEACKYLLSHNLSNQWKEFCYQK